MEGLSLTEQIKMLKLPSNESHNISPRDMKKLLKKNSFKLINQIKENKVV